MHTGLSIIIVNYNSTSLLLQCINSFIYKISIPNYEILVVDNYSKDSPEQILNEHFQDVQFLQTGYNAGFARANNEGIKIARYNTLLLLNADTIVHNNAITDCYELLLNSEYVSCGVQLLNTDGSMQISGSHVMTGGLNYLLPLPYTGNFLGWLAKQLHIQKPSIENAKSSEEVDWINGAFLMVKREAIEKAGLLDEEFFLYMEEIEWCSRLKKYGRLVLFGDINVTHLQGETTKEFYKTKAKGYQNLCDEMGRQLMISIWLRQRKQFGLFWFLFLVAAYGFEIPIFFFGLFFFKILKKTSYSLSDFLGYARNYFNNLRYFWFIARRKNHFYKVV